MQAWPDVLFTSTSFPDPQGLTFQMFDLEAFIAGVPASPDVLCLIFP